MAELNCQGLKKLNRSIMQLSTNVPSGSNAIQNHIVIRGETGLPNNVRPEADAAYVSEKGLRSGNERMSRWPVGTCSRCSATIYNAPYLSQREDGKFCSQFCRDTNPQAVKSGRPRLTAKQREKSNSKRLEYQRSLMRSRRGSVLAKNPFQPIDNMTLADANFAS
jgi:hypothetical protein